MKGIHRALAVTAVAAVVLIPIASASPDGLQRVILTFGARSAPPIWSGIFPGYSLAVTGNGLVDKALAALLGLLLVFGVGCLIASLLMNGNSKRAEASAVELYSSCAV